MNKKLELVRERRLTQAEEKRLLETALEKMNTGEHRFAGPLLHDRLIGALELYCRRGEMLLIQNRRVVWETCQIAIPGATAKDKENRKIPFDPEGRLAPILKRRAALGPDAYVFGAEDGAFQPNIQTAWETLRLLAYGHEPRRGPEEIAWNQARLREIDLRWHDLRHEGACRLHADGVDIRIIQLMLGYASIQQTQRYLSVTDEELRRGLAVSWKNRVRVVPPQQTPRDESARDAVVPAAPARHGGSADIDAQLTSTANHKRTANHEHERGRVLPFDVRSRARQGEAQL